MKPLQFHYANLAKHGVSPKEIEECLTGLKRRYFHRIRRKVYQVIAQTAAGRYLEVVFEDDLRSGMYFTPWMLDRGISNC